MRSSVSVVMRPPLRSRAASLPSLTARRPKVDSARPVRRQYSEISCSSCCAFMASLAHLRHKAPAPISSPAPLGSALVAALLGSVDGHSRGPANQAVGPRSTTFLPTLIVGDVVGKNGPLHTRVLRLRASVSDNWVAEWFSLSPRNGVNPMRLDG